MQHYVIKFVSDLRQVGGFLYQYNWNIVESGVKHHKPNQSIGAKYKHYVDLFVYSFHFNRKSIYK